MKRSLLSVATLLVISLAGLALSAGAQAQKTRFTDNPQPPQPLYTDFRGVRLGMTPQEVRAKLGNPVLKDEELDYFVISDTLTAQIAYDHAHKVKTISVDYAGGVGAPEYRGVVGTALDTRPDGSQFKMMRYEAQGLWVSYNRTAGPVTIVTITIQKM
jgi:hypothetical protein